MSAMSIQPVNNAARQASTQLTCHRFLATARYTVSSYRLFATRIQSLFQYRLSCTRDTLSLYLDFSPCEVVHSYVNGYTQFLCFYNMGDHGTQRSRFSIWAVTTPSTSLYSYNSHIIPYGLPSTQHFSICNMRHLPNFNNGFSPCEYQPVLFLTFNMA